jgi:hypothetical protein
MRFGVVQAAGLVAIAGLLNGCDADTTLGPETGDALFTAIKPNSSASSAAPLNLASTAEHAGQIDLTWQDNSGNEDGFEIQRATGSS